MLPMLAMAAVSGGLSALSGIGARNSAKKQARLQKIENDRVRVENESEAGRINEWNYNIGRELLANPTVRTHEEDSYSSGGIDVDRMMADADRAGFNPVTWLQAGAASAYAYTNSSGWTRDSETNPVQAFQMMLKTPNFQTADQIGKIPDAMEIMGDAGQAALNTFRSEYAREDSQQFQREQLGLQLKAIQDGRQKSGFGYTPRETSAGSRATKSVPLLTDNGVLSTMSNAQIKQPEVTPALFGPRSWFQNDLRWPNSNSVTDVYGEGMADYVYGPTKFANDLLLSTTRAAGIGNHGVGYYDLMDFMTAGAGIGKEAVGPMRPWLAEALKPRSVESMWQATDPRWRSLDPRQNLDWAKDFYGNPNRDQPWLGSGM